MHMRDKVVHTVNQTQYLLRKDSEHDHYTTHESHGTETTSLSIDTGGMTLASYYKLSSPSTSQSRSSLHI